MVKIGQSVTLNYTGRLKDGGEVFDTTEGRDPQTFRLGTDPLIEGFQRALIDKQIGDKFTFEVPKDMAYGEYDNEKVTEVSKDLMPGEVEEGQILGAEGPNGTVRVIVKEIKEETVVLDGNHPLAGQDLEFDVEILNAE